MTAAGFSAQIDDLRSVADRFARLRDDAADLLRTTSTALAGAAGMAGRDPVPAPWRARYDAVVAAQWAAATVAVQVLGAIAAKLRATTDTYLAAEHAATPGADGPPEVGGHPAARVVVPPPAPPSSTGSGGPAVPDLVAEYHPGGDPERIAAAGRAWRELGDELARIGLAGDTAFRTLFTTGTGAAFSAMRTFWARQYVPSGTEALLNAVADAAGLLGANCAALAALVVRTRDETEHAAAEAARDMSPLELPAVLLGEVAWGLPELELFVGTVALAASYLRDNRAAYLFSLDRLVGQLSAEVEQRLRRVAVPPPADAPTGVGLDDVGQIAGLGLIATGWDRLADPHPDPDTIHIVEARVTHILRGDRTGGGHAPGTGRPGKSEFPIGWTDPHILVAAFDVARDPDTVTRSRLPGRWVAEAWRDGVLIRVVVLDSGVIWTVVPLKGFGVITNPK